jgi:hypothetical protein
MSAQAYERFEKGMSRAMDARAANERIADKAERLHFIARVPMICECSSPDCRTLVMIGVEDYRAIRHDHDHVLVAPGRDADQAELLTKAPDYEVRRTSRTADGNGNNNRRSA